MFPIKSIQIKTLMKCTWTGPGITFRVHDSMANFYGRPCLENF